MQSRRAYGGSDDTPLAELAAAQHGVVSWWQLLELGYSRRGVERRTSAGRLHRIHRAVYAVGHTKLTARSRWMAAVLACGGPTQTALLSHHDAAALHDLRTIPTGATHVTAPSRHQLDGIICHLTRCPLDRVVIDGIPATTLERTFLDEAELVHPQRLGDLLERAQQQDKLNLLRLEPLLDATPGHRGLKPIRAALAHLADVPQWLQSELERRFMRLLDRHGLPRPTQTNVFIAGELIDCVWEAERLIVEVDGWKFHKTKRSFEADRRRDAKLVALGWRVIRITDRRLRDEPDVVAAEIARALRAWPSPGR